MIHRCRLLLFGLVLVAAGSAAVADDVVHFANGTFMKVQGYTVEGDMIKVTLGPGATMSFPTTLVESIERSGRTIYPQSQAGAPSNVVASGSAGGMVSGGGQYLQTGDTQTPARHRPGALSGESTIEDKESVARRDQTQYQMSGNRAPLRALGRRSVPAGEGLVDKDPSMPPPGTIGRPRTFTSLAPRLPSAAPAPEPTPGAPVDPAPTEPEPQDDPPAEPEG